MKGKTLSLFAVAALLLGVGFMTSTPKAFAGDNDFEGNDFKKEVRVKVDKDFDGGFNAAALHGLMAGHKVGALVDHNMGMMTHPAFGLVGDNDFKKEVRVKVERDNDGFGLLGDNDFKKEVRIKVDRDNDNDFRDFADNDFKKEVRVKVENDRD